MMKIFIDGNGLLTTLRELRPALIVEEDPLKSRKKIARWLARYAEYQNCDLELVFGENETVEIVTPFEAVGGVQVRNLNTDEEVLKQIAGPANRLAQQQEVQVVTADERLRSALQKSDARVLTPKTFADRVAETTGGHNDTSFDEPGEKYTGVPDEEVSFWVNFFDDD
ncbi:MAG: NYN domain-containing protein [Planctomycetes bacterium]|nr:NYN domain-containing protein [Planctomycetota bacterium]